MAAHSHGQVQRQNRLERRVGFRFIRRYATRPQADWERRRSRGARLLFLQRRCGPSRCKCRTNSSCVVCLTRFTVLKQRYARPAMHRNSPRRRPPRLKPPCRAPRQHPPAPFQIPRTCRPCKEPYSTTPLFVTPLAPRTFCTSSRRCTAHYSWDTLRLQ